MLLFLKSSVMQNFRHIISVIVSFFFCASFASAQTISINRFAEVVDSLHRSIVFPYTVAPGITLVNVRVDTDNKLLVINYMLNPDVVDAVANNASTENGIAQLLTGYDEIFSTSMLEAEAGCKILISFPSNNGGIESKIVTITPSAISEVYHKLKNGDFTPLKSYLEMLQSTFSNMKFPFQVSNGINLIDAYIANNDVYWIYEIKGELVASDISDEIIQNNRFNLISSLRINIAPEYITEIEEKGIAIHYVYKNSKSEPLFDFTFTANDLK